MDKLDKLPWYHNYTLILEGKKIAEKEIEDLQNPEKQLQRIKKFYQNLGADSTANNWIVKAEQEVNVSVRGENSRVNQLKREVQMGTAIENAVEKQDEQSISEMLAYKEDENYGKTIQGIMFYLGVSKTKTDAGFIEKAYAAIAKKYLPDNTSLFIREGVHYYVYYLQCLQEFIKKHRNYSSYEDIKSVIRSRCMNIQLMFSDYQSDMYISEQVQSIIEEVRVVEALISESGE